MARNTARRIVRLLRQSLLRRFFFRPLWFPRLCVSPPLHVRIEPHGRLGRWGCESLAGREILLPAALVPAPFGESPLQDAETDVAVGPRGRFSSRAPEILPPCAFRSRAGRSAAAAMGAVNWKGCARLLLFRAKERRSTAVARIQAAETTVHKPWRDARLRAALA